MAEQQEQAAPDAMMTRIGQVVMLHHGGDREEARGRFLDLWAEIGEDGDPLHRCTLAHYMADTQDDPSDELAWDLRALSAAEELTDGDGLAGARRSRSRCAALLPVPASESRRRLCEARPLRGRPQPSAPGPRRGRRPRGRRLRGRCPGGHRPAGAAARRGRDSGSGEGPGSLGGPGPSAGPEARRWGRRDGDPDRSDRGRRRCVARRRWPSRSRTDTGPRTRRLAGRRRVRQRPYVALADDRLRAVRRPAPVLPAEGAHIRGRRDIRATGGTAMRGRGVGGSGMRGGAAARREGRPGPRRAAEECRPARCGRAGRRACGTGRCSLQRLPRRRLHDLRLGLGRPDAAREGPDGAGGEAGSGRPLDGHTAGEGRDGHGDQERRGRRCSMHPRNSAVPGPFGERTSAGCPARVILPLLREPGPATPRHGRPSTAPTARADATSAYASERRVKASEAARSNPADAHPLRRPL